ncbi:MAG TPA: 30S ribosomal protein S20 [Candidatus Dojkabacteria bacterium]|jgi:small subunit ribosomal protein S20|nr:30S ribosomal protein S20 [Candidatus Dojkabacteria bacterium]HOF78803.1 30S ribosomal protein S20 [Candidatus Dojkabacteria bacterium]HOR05810.1 30S ribosomal protein S20 [Candidatus Dojkabacteria bacterium]HOT61144.1 30S ribosomal protein S20 [Candidatus Dojkabacteria bacterium]HQI92389.1 30S ribosomal protein S20 [Candidatus Dojkabacteria bacterium]
MPNLKTSIKDLRQTKKREKVNDRFKNRIKKAVKKTDSLIKDGKDTEAKITLKNVYKVLDKAAKKNVIKNKKADRIKSRLSKKLNKLTPNNVKTAKKGA